jgi:hypothetical protein
VSANHIGLRAKTPDLVQDGSLNCRDDLFGGRGVREKMLEVTSCRIGIEIGGM